MEVNGIKVYPVGEMTPAHSYNRYDFENVNTESNNFRLDLPPATILTLLFQDGNPATHGLNGLTGEAILEAVKHRLETFQTGPFACHENALAAEHIGKALEALYSRGRRVAQPNQQPTVKPYTVWMEGFAATGQNSRASLVGTVEATSFQEACEKLYETATDKSYWNKEKTAIWGCRLFDNEADARKSFG